MKSPGLAPESDKNAILSSTAQEKDDNASKPMRAVSAATERKKPLPCGQVMWDRTIKVKQNVRQLLEAIPGTRGDDRLLEYYHRVRYEGWTPWRPLTNNQAIEMVRKWVSAETIIRRRAEWQNAKNEDGSWKYPHLRPKERTQRKRQARDNAVSHYYGNGYTLPDFIAPEAQS